MSVQSLDFTLIPLCAKRAPFDGRRVNQSFPKDSRQSGPFGGVSCISAKHLRDWPLFWTCQVDTSAFGCLTSNFSSETRQWQANQHLESIGTRRRASRASSLRNNVCITNRTNSSSNLQPSFRSRNMRPQTGSCGVLLPKPNLNFGAYPIPRSKFWVQRPQPCGAMQECTAIERPRLLFLAVCTARSSHRYAVSSANASIALQ